MALTITGVNGRLRCGARTVATFRGWRADSRPDGRFSLVVDALERDPVWWEGHDPERLQAELTLRTSVWRGHARVTSPDLPAIEIWRTNDGSD